MEQIIPQNNSEQTIVADIRAMIADARKRVAVSANAAITLLYWHIGERINREVLGNQRAEYGKKLLRP